MIKEIPISFYCVGTQKAGTTSLHDILKHHTDLFLPESKEAHFFHKEERYEKGLVYYYATFFKEYNNEKAVGSFTPEYLFYEEVPARLKKHYGKDLKIIIILREPVSRAYSHYLMSKRRGFEELLFEEAVEKEKDRMKEGGEFEKRHLSYISRGLYFDQVKRYYELFDKNNILILSFEKDIKNKIKETVREIQMFLGIEHIDLNVEMKSNPASDAKMKSIRDFLFNKNYIKDFLGKFMKEETKKKIKERLVQMNEKPITKKHLDSRLKEEMLQKYFLSDIKKLENLTNMNFSYWYDEIPHP